MPKKVYASIRPDGTYGVLSSDGETVYTVRPKPLSCTCPGFTNHGHCYHATAVAQALGIAE